MVWNWSPAQISQLSGVSLTTASSGSMGACARYGNSKLADDLAARGGDGRARIAILAGGQSRLRRQAGDTPP